jgi:hypothetical protein
MEPVCSAGKPIATGTARAIARGPWLMSSVGLGTEHAVQMTNPDSQHADFGNRIYSIKLPDTTDVLS